MFFVCCLGGWLFFLLFGRGVRVFFLLFGRGRVLFLLFGRGRVLFFAVWAGGVFFFLLFGRGTGVHSLTRLPGSSLSDPTKETEQQKKKTGSRFRQRSRSPAGAVATAPWNSEAQAPRLHHLPAEKDSVSPARLQSFVLRLWQHLTSWVATCGL